MQDKAPTLTDPAAIVVSTESMSSAEPTEVVESNIDFVNALRRELFELDELSADALRSYYVDFFYAQVQNGGFSQFVFNTRWNETVVGFVRSGLKAMNAEDVLAAFETGAAFVERTGTHTLDEFLATDYFGDNPARDAYDGAFDADVESLPTSNAQWLRDHPKLVVASIDEMLAEVKRRAATQPDRAERVARARASEPRELKLMRALCEKAGHEFNRRTAADLRTYEGNRLWAHYFVTDRGPHFMLDLGTSALMFPTLQGSDREAPVDPSTRIVEIDCPSG